MPILSNNSNAFPAAGSGSSVQNGTYANSVPYYAYTPDAGQSHRVTTITTINQVAGLVPLFPCDAIECRLGKYGSDDSQFMLPVFAQDQTSIAGDYFNDTNSWLFDFPADAQLTRHSFFLDSYANGAWTERAALNDDKHGIFYYIGRLCKNNYYTGYQIYWNLVLHTFGEGVYRFRVEAEKGSLTPSVNHIKITGYKHGAKLRLTTTGYGDICPTFFIDDADSFDVTMQKLTIWTNNYQAATYASPLFSATWNAASHQVDLFGLLGQNCPSQIIENDTTYSLYAQSFTNGVNDYQDLGCFATPPFCLKTWSCFGVDRTTRFDAYYSGGVIGNIDKSLPGTTWSFCCVGKPVVYTSIKSYFWIRFWAGTTITTPATMTFGMPAGVSLVPPVTFAPGLTYIQMAQYLTTQINAYQATLGTPQFSALYNSINKECEITHLYGQNLVFSITLDEANPADNNIQYTVNQLIGYSSPPVPPTPPADRTYSLNQFFGGAAINQADASPAPINWKDSIRIGGEFGYETTEHEKKSIKYQTGVVNKVRDELLLRFTWKSSSLPFWFHERFKAYGRMADKLLVSDYNLNNADYNLKLFSVQAEGAYNPDYKNYKRETQVKCEFVPAVQNLKRQRCC